MPTEAPELGEVYFLGTVHPNPELLTAAALRRLREANVIFSEPGVAIDFSRVLPARPPEHRTLDPGDSTPQSVERLSDELALIAKGGTSIAWLCASSIPDGPLLRGVAGALRRAGIRHEILACPNLPLLSSAYSGIRLDTDCTAEFGGSTASLTVQACGQPTQRIIASATTRELHQAAGTHFDASDSRVITALRWFDRQPLFGQRILVTRPIHQSEAMVRWLWDRGAQPLSVPAIRIAPPESMADLHSAINEASGYDWVIFTSANGVSAFFEAADTLGRDARSLAGPRLCAIGPATAEALRNHGLCADLQPERFVGEAVAEAILERESDGPSRILLPRAAVARNTLPDMLKAAGHQVDIAHAYQTLGPRPVDRAHIRQLVDRGAVDVLTFTSPSTVRAVAEALSQEGASAVKGLVIACIGPITSRAARAQDWPVHVEPKRYTARALVHALSHFFDRKVRVSSGSAPHGN